MAGASAGTHADGRRAAGSEQNALEISRGQLGELLGQTDGWDIGVTSRAKGELSHLPGDCLDHARMSSDVGCVLLTGNGPSPKDGGWAFCAGGDQRIRGRDGYRYASGATAEIE